MNTTDKTCSNYFFGTPTHNGKMCECHANRPVSTGKFPVVRTCDYCGNWTDEHTLCRPFANLPTDPWCEIPKPNGKKPEQPNEQEAKKKGGKKDGK